MSDRANELKQIINDARDELNDLEQNRRKEHNQNFVGKFFRYQNGYNAQDKWWLYVFVRGLTADGYCRTDKFETNNDRETIIALDGIHYHPIKNYKEITELEFMKAWERLTQTVNGVKFQI